MGEGEYELKWSFENTKKLFLSYPPDIFLVLIVFGHFRILKSSTKLLIFIAVSKTKTVSCVVVFTKDHETVIVVKLIIGF